MKKKIMFLCIGAVLILVLAGFSNVIGVQTKINKKKESPLFNNRLLRSKNNKNENSKRFNYLGNEMHTLSFTFYNKNQDIIKKISDYFSNNQKVIDNSINYILKNKKYINILAKSGISLSQFEQKIEEIKNNEGAIEHYLTKAANINPKIGQFLGSIEVDSEQTADLKCIATAMLLLILIPIFIPIIIVGVVLLVVFTMLIIPCLAFTYEPEGDCSGFYDLQDLLEDFGAECGY